MLLVVLLEQSGTAGTAWNKCWDSLSRPSQLGTLLGELEFWDNCPVLSSAVQVRVDLLMFERAVLPHILYVRFQDRRSGLGIDSPGSDAFTAEANTGADTCVTPVSAPIEITSAWRHTSCSTVAVPAGGVD